MSRSDQVAIPNDWKDWISHNVSQGCSLDEIFKILHDHGFDYEVIRTYLSYEPNLPLDEIENPLYTASSQEVSESKEPTKGRGGIYIPNAERLDSPRIELYTLENFLSFDECRKLRELIRLHLRPSTITNAEQSAKNFRTSKTCDLALLNDPFVKELDQRICKIMGINPTYSEGIQAQVYDVGEQFKPHTDYFEPCSREFHEHARNLGQRTWTFMIYLNTTDKGGETRFVELGKTIYPREGTALIWNNLYPNGAPNPDTLHEGMPVVQGDKAIITKWFRAKGTGAMITKEDNEYIRNYTRLGIKKLSIPSDIHSQLVEYYEEKKQQARIEIVKGFVESPHRVSSEVIELPDSIRAVLHRRLKSICEEWCGEALEPTYVYGIRRYKHGATLRLHRDRIETHIISAILIVAQNVNEDWPLEIEDNYYRKHEIVVAPGEMILYEGGRLEHGRPKPLNGDYFCNAYVHYKPSNYSPPVVSGNSIQTSFKATKLCDMQDESK